MSDSEGESNFTKDVAKAWRKYYDDITTALCVLVALLVYAIFVPWPMEEGGDIDPWYLETATKVFIGGTALSVGLVALLMILAVVAPNERGPLSMANDEVPRSVLSFFTKYGPQGPKFTWSTTRYDVTTLMYFGMMILIRAGLIYGIHVACEYSLLPLFCEVLFSFTNVIGHPLFNILILRRSHKYAVSANEKPKNKWLKRPFKVFNWHTMMKEMKKELAEVMPIADNKKRTNKRATKKATRVR